MKTTIIPRMLCLSCVTLLLWGCSDHPSAVSQPEELGFSTERLQRLDDVLSGYIEREDLAGLVALIARKGQIAHFEAIGDARLEPRRKMEKDTLFRIYSMTKPITSVAVMILYEQGALMLKDPISKFIPELGDLQVYVSGSGESMVTEPAEREVMVLDLLTHTSGFIYDFPGNEPEVLRRYKALGIVPTGYWLGNPGERPTEVHDHDGFIQKLAQVPLAHQPGERFSYGVNTDLLGIIVQRVAGMPFEEFLKQRIFEPLEMTDTAFHVSKKDVKRFAASYTLDAAGKLMLQDDPEADSPFVAPPTFVSGGGGLVSTATDYFRFCQMLLNGGELDGVRLLSPHTVKYMRTNLLGSQVGLDRGVPEFVTGYHQNSLGFGLGFAVAKNPAHLSGPVGEGEFWWGGAATTEFWIDPENELVAVLMTQMVPSNTYPIASKFKTMVYQALLE